MSLAIPTDNHLGLEDGEEPTEETNLLSSFSLRRAESDGQLAWESIPVHGNPEGSTFGQALVNCIGDLVGTGLLASPLAIAYCGWVFGPLLLIFLGWVTMRTLKYLCRILLKNPQLHTYTEIVSFALGPKSHMPLTILFLFEIFAWTMAMLILFSDTINAVLPILTADQWKIASAILIFPTMFLPIRLLSYTSFLGILSSIVLIVIIFWDGFTTSMSPGSILHPSPYTSIWPQWVKLPVALGLMMSSYGGHGIIPVLVRDMKEPERWESIVNISYAVALLICGSVGCAGYAMFGWNVSDEISLDIARTPGFNVFFNTLAVWMVAINPLTKVPMALVPLNDIVEILIGIYPTPISELRLSSSPIPSPTSSGATTPRHGHSKSAAKVVIEEDLSSSDLELLRKFQKKEKVKTGFRIVSRVAMAALLIGISIAIPSFEFVLALLGASTAYIIGVIIPLAANMILEKKWNVIDVILIIGTTIMGCWATGQLLIDNFTGQK